MSSVDKAAIQRRTIRQFKQTSIPEKLIFKWIEAARMAPSAANIQPCEYIVVNQKDVVKLIFPCLKWAGYITPAGDPAPENRPVIYIVVLINKGLDKGRAATDAGAAIQNLILTAWEDGVGSCWLGSINRTKLRTILELPESCTIDSIVAHGYPAEKPIAEDMKDSIQYWKDAKGILHVPKRLLNRIVHMNRFTPSSQF